MGNSASVHAVLGSRNIAKNDRAEHDYYATEPKAAHLLMQVERFSPTIWECACGEGHLAKVFEQYGHTVYASDLVDRGYGEQLDFLEVSSPPVSGADIITNPPYILATDFVRHALEISEDRRKIAMFLKIQFLEGKERRKLFEEHPPKTIYVSSSRLHCARNGDFAKAKEANAICFAWYVWEKGWRGDTVVKWIN